MVAAELLGQSSVDLLLALLTAEMEDVLQAASEVQVPGVWLAMEIAQVTSRHSY